MELLPATVMTRLKPIGIGIQDQYFTIDHGGNSQPTYPSIGPEFLRYAG